MSITQHIIIFRGPHWLACTRLSSEWIHSYTHTAPHTSAGGSAPAHLYVSIQVAYCGSPQYNCLLFTRPQELRHFDCLLLHGRRASSLSVILSITDFGHQIPREEGIDISAFRYIIYHGFWPSDSAGRRHRYISSQVYYLSRIAISRYPRELSLSIGKI